MNNITKFKIEYLSLTENKLVINAQRQYGHIFDNARNLVSLIWNFPKEVKREGWIFISFLSQVQKFLTLSLLSTIRMHDVQTNMMLRQVLESGVLACYALYNTKLESFGYINNSTGLVHENTKATETAYKWLENNYKTYSDKIKYMKGKINELFAHSNMINTTNNFEFKDSEMTVLFFDKPHDIITQQRLWWIANISFGLLDLFSKLINDFPLIKLGDDFTTEMQVLGAENERIKQELMNEPRFAKWL